MPGTVAPGSDTNPPTASILDLWCPTRGAASLMSPTQLQDRRGGRAAPRSAAQRSGRAAGGRGGGAGGRGRGAGGLHDAEVALALVGGDLAPVLLPFAALVAQEELEHVLAQDLGDQFRAGHHVDR